MMKPARTVRFSLATIFQKLVGTVWLSLARGSRGAGVGPS
jgi:hypothetical protein